MITSGFSLAFNGKNLLENSKEMLWQRNIYQVTTSTDGHGTMTASPMSGFSGTNVTLSNTPNANYDFANYSITGATLTGNQFTLNNDVTAQANFSAVPIMRNVYGYGSLGGFSGNGTSLDSIATLGMPLTHNTWNVDETQHTARIDLTVSSWNFSTGDYISSYGYHSSYYDTYNSTKSDKYYFTANGLNKPIHVTRVAITGAGFGIEPNRMGIKSADDAQWMSGWVASHYHTKVFEGFDWVLNDKIYCYVNTVYNDTLYLEAHLAFTGYIIE